MTEHMYAMNLRECPNCRGKRFVIVLGTPITCNLCEGHGYIPADDQSSQDAPISEMAKAQKRIAELEAERQVIIEELNEIIARSDFCKIDVKLLVARLKRATPTDRNPKD